MTMKWEVGMFAVVGQPGFCHLEVGTLVRLVKFDGENKYGYGPQWITNVDGYQRPGYPPCGGDRGGCTLAESRMEEPKD